MFSLSIGELYILYLVCFIWIVLKQNLLLVFPTITHEATAGYFPQPSVRHAIIKSIIAIVPPTARIWFNRFQGVSNPALTFAISCDDADFRLKASSLLFNGIFPKIVIPSTPTR